MSNILSTQKIFALVSLICIIEYNNKGRTVTAPPLGACLKFSISYLLQGKDH